jgi:hypothetical protein
MAALAAQAEAVGQPMKQREQQHDCVQGGRAKRTGSLCAKTGWQEHCSEEHKGARPGPGEHLLTLLQQCQQLATALQRPDPTLPAYQEAAAAAKPPQLATESTAPSPNFSSLEAISDSNARCPVPRDQEAPLSDTVTAAASSGSGAACLPTPQAVEGPPQTLAAFLAAEAQRKVQQAMEEFQTAYLTSPASMLRPLWLLAKAGLGGITLKVSCSAQVLAPTACLGFWAVHPM